jgi:hypothetical protein
VTEEATKPATPPRSQDRQNYFQNTLLRSNHCKRDADEKDFGASVGEAFPILPLVNSPQKAFASRIVVSDMNPFECEGKFAYVTLSVQTPAAFAESAARQVPVSRRCSGQPGVL